MMQSLTEQRMVPAVMREGLESTVIQHFSLPGVLSQEHILALHRPLGILVDLSCVSASPQMLASQQFTFSELCVLVPLLEAFPDYCPYEVLLAYFSHNSASITGETIEECRRHLHRALLEGLFEQEMRPVRNVVSRTRLKLHAFGIDITSLLETGYLLRPRPKKQRRSREVSAKTL